MSRTLEARAEIAKLARLLGTQPDRLAYLERVEPAQITALREQATDRLFDAHGEALQRAVAASRILPAPLTAKIGEKAFGALLCARVAGLLSPADAVDMARRLPPEFLADVAVEIDPRRASDVIGRIPVERVVAVARILVLRGEHVTMGRFVGHLSHETIEATLEILDEASLLRTAFVMEDKHRLEDIVALLSDERLAGVIVAAASDGLWPEGLDLVTHVTDETRGRVAEVASAQPDAVLDALVTVAHEQGLWDVLLPFTRSMTLESRARFARLPSIQRAAVLDAIVRTAVSDGLWGELLPLLPVLPPRSRRRVAATAARLDVTLFEGPIDDGHVEGFLLAVGEYGLEGEMVTLAEALPPDVRRRLGERAAELGMLERMEGLRSTPEGE